MDPESSGGGDGRNESHRPLEQPAVVTTIVGGRPPGAGLPIGTIPRGIEVLVKKAAVDAKFRLVLLDQRADAAAVIGLQLEPAEVMMLRAISREQLATIVARTSVPETQRRTFLGQAASAMLATLGLACASCHSRTPPPAGIAPDRPHPDKAGPSDPPEAEGLGKHHE